MTDQALPRQAQLTPKTDAAGKEIPAARRRPIPVQFNPETLELVIRNELTKNEQRRRQQPPQYVTSTSATLAMALVFDTTTSGADVRGRTGAIAALMQPDRVTVEGKKKRIPAVVIFEWSTFVFEGYISDYKETIEFFSPEGVPLRATLNLTLTQQEQPLPTPSQQKQADVGDAFPSVEPPAPLGSGQSIDNLAAAAGDRKAAADIARANGVENRRNPEVDSVALPERGGAGGAPPAGRPPAAFAGASARTGASAGADAGAFAGASALAGASAEAGAFAGAGADAGAFAGASARTGAFAGAGAGADAFAGAAAGGITAPFAGLNARAGLDLPTPRVELSLEPPQLPSLSLDLSAGLEAGAGLLTAGAGFGAAAGAGVGIGGVAQAGAGLNADVGTNLDLAAIIFEED